MLMNVIVESQILILHHEQPYIVDLDEVSTVKVE